MPDTASAPRVRFWEFSQNNSGGEFDIDDATGIGPRVWIEALSAADANARAGSLGIYFDGVDGERDCPCCGDRWYPVRDEAGEDTPGISADFDFSWHPVVYIHRLAGDIERVTKPAGRAA